MNFNKVRDDAGMKHWEHMTLNLMHMYVCIYVGDSSQSGQSRNETLN
jgi:biotin synthase-related radical SAM superfamily protein